MPKPESKRESLYLRTRQELTYLCHGLAELRWWKRAMNRARRISGKKQIRDELNNPRE